MKDKKIYGTAQKRRNISIDDERKAKLEAIGNGNLSAGIRKACDVVGWIKVKDRLPETIETKHESCPTSNEMPVLIKGRAGWATAVYMDHGDGDAYWRIVGFHGDHVVTHWYDLLKEKKK